MMRKGAKTERELVKKFLESGWQAARIAGSGQLDKAPDVIAGCPSKLLVLECKARKKDVVYLDKEEVLNVISYAIKFGGEPWYGFRFNYHDWRFVHAKELIEKKKVKKGQGIDFEKLILKDKKVI